MITNLYIDGFNLYYRAVRHTGFKWLNLHKLSQILFPQDTIQQICYFTALLTSRADDPTRRRRQLVYLRALATLPGIEIHYGKFRSSKEKGSDVNLATRLLVDGFNNSYEQAVILSNDADFVGAMRYVKDNLRRRVVLLNPDPNNTSPRELVESATYVKRLWPSHLRRSQFPDKLADENGTITKPITW